MSDALYDGPNRVIIDDNTPETNTLPVSGGKGVDEFLITLTANSVVIDDDSEANVIVFERDVVITSIERPAGSEGASVAQYVITLSSGKTITLRNPASFTFQHLGDATRTAPISAEDFFTAYEDGFAASDASHTVTGANDAPEITVSGGVSVEDGATVLPADVLTIEDDNGGIAAYTSGSFTLAAGTGATAAIVNKFEVVQDANGRWQFALKSGESISRSDAATFVINVSVTDAAGSTSTIVPVSFTVSPALNVDQTNSEVEGALYKGDTLVSGDLDINDPSLITLAGANPFTISGQGTYGTATIDDDGTWVYKLTNNNADVQGLAHGQTETDTFEVTITTDAGITKTQTITITISGRTDVLGSAGADTIDESANSNNVTLFGGNSGDTLIGGSGDDLIVGGFGKDTIDLRVGGADTVIVRVDSNDVSVDPPVMQAYDGGDDIKGFTPGEDKLVIADIASTTVDLAGFFSPIGRLQIALDGDEDLSSEELDAGVRYVLRMNFNNSGKNDGETGNAGSLVRVFFDRETSEALNGDYYDTITGGTGRNAFVVADTDRLIQLFGGEEFLPSSMLMACHQLILMSRKNK